MDSNSSTSSSDLLRWVRRMAVFIALIFSSNLILLLWVFAKPDKMRPPAVPHGAHRVLILGASNVAYGIDTSMIPGSTVVSIKEPYGVYGSLLALREMAGQGDVIICDYPYSWLDPQKFVPATAQFYHALTADRYLQLCRDYPVFWLKNFLLTNVLNAELRSYLLRGDKGTISKGTEDGGEATHDPGKDLTGYNNCTEPYNKARHFIYESSADEAHLTRIRNFVESVEKEKGATIFFKYPELNRGNYDVNKKLVECMGRNFKMINTFEDWPNDKMYDQWYHLNACGRTQNSENIARFLTAKGYIRPAS